MCRMSATRSSVPLDYVLLSERRRLCRVSSSMAYSAINAGRVKCARDSSGRVWIPADTTRAQFDPENHQKKDTHYQRNARLMPNKIDGPKLILKLPYEMVEALDKIASRTSHNRSEAIRQACNDYIIKHMPVLRGEYALSSNEVRR